MSNNDNNSVSSVAAERQDYSNSDFERTVNDYLLIIRDRAVPAITVAGLITIILVTWMLTRPDEYEATSAILFSPKRENVVDFKQVVEDSVSNELAISMHMHTYVERMKSVDFLDHVVSALDRKERTLILQPYLDDGLRKEDLPSLLTLLEEGLEINSLKNSFILEVKIRERSQEGVALLANRLIHEFIRNSMSYTGERNDAALVFLQEQADELKELLEKSENELQAFRRKYKLVSLEDSQNIVVERMKSFNEAATQARLTRLDAETLVTQIEEAAKIKGDLLEISYLSQYGPIPQLRQSLLELEAEREVLDEKYLRRHPRVIQNGRSVKIIEKQIKDNINLAVQDVRAGFKKALASEKQLQAELRKAEADSLQLDQISVEFNILERDLESNKKTYYQVLTRLQETRISTQISEANIKIVDKARVPIYRVWPSYLKTSLLAVAFFTAIFWGSILLFELVDSKLKTPWDVEHLVGVNLLGTIPYINILNAKKSTTKLSEEDENVVAESMRAIYSHAQVNSRVRVNQSRAILITSTIPNEGKTTIASKIAKIYAGHGFETIVVDADFRRPSLHNVFDKSNEDGCVQELGNANQNNVAVALDNLNIQRVDARLSLLTSGGTTRLPTELIDSNAYPTLVHALRSAYNIIIIDSPPIGVFPDALLLGRFADEVVYVTRYGKVSRTGVRDIVQKFKDIELPVLGMILNADKSKKITYGYGAYGNAAKKYREEYAKSDKSRSCDNA